MVQQGLKVAPAQDAGALGVDFITRSQPRNFLSNKEFWFLHTLSTHFCDHSRFMPDCVEKACNISCCSGDRVGTGLEEGVGAGMAKALWISSGLAFLTNSSSLTIHSLGDNEYLQQLLRDPHPPTSLLL